jgi:hypothetical protein
MAVIFASQVLGQPLAPRCALRRQLVMSARRFGRFLGLLQRLELCAQAGLVLGQRLLEQA